MDPRFLYLKKKKSNVALSTIIHNQLQTPSNITLPTKSHRQPCPFTRSSRISTRPTFLNPQNSLTTPPLPFFLDLHPLHHSSLTLEYVERPILLVLVLESAGRGRTAGERLEKRRKCRFPREQKLPQARSAVRFISARRSILGGRSLSTRWSFAGGRCTRSPNADYALFILYKREQPCTGLPQFVRTGSRETPRRQSRGFQSRPRAIHLRPPS